eukprot:UN10259
MSLETLNFYESPTVMETEITSFSHVLRTLNFT